MLAPADALPLTVERAGEPQWPQAVTRSVQDHCDVSEFDKSEIGRDAFAPLIIEGQSSWRAPGSHSTSSPPSIIS